MLIMKEILDPKYGMFKFYEESRFVWFNRKVGGANVTGSRDVEFPCMMFKHFWISEMWWAYLV